MSPNPTRGGLSLTIKPGEQLHVGDAVLTFERRVRVHIRAPQTIEITRVVPERDDEVGE